ncbi:MAG: hypothetical protein HC836_47300, partial [Richelia sp. RM2_1_2]|nr:hypothetical protein [Richelia sp. RM2_1_2]
EIVSLHGRQIKAETKVIREKIEDLQFYDLKQTCIKGIVVANKIKWCCGSLAYLIRRDAIAKFLSRPWDGVPVDIAIANFYKFCILDPSPFDHERKYGSLVENPR